VRPRHEVGLVPGDHHAGPRRRVGGYDRLARDRAATDPELAERPVRVPHEEPADDRLVDVVRRAPDVEPFRLGEVGGADAGGRTRVAHGIDRGRVAVGERLPPEEVLDPVHPRSRKPRPACVAPGRIPPDCP
jgi:hypothetical protein